MTKGGDKRSAAMWGGRFSEGMDSLVKRVNASIHVDSAMAREDLEGSLAHAIMLTETGILEQEDGKAIEEGLRQLLVDLDNDRLEFDEELEDIHMNLEHLLTERIGAVIRQEVLSSSSVTRAFMI